MGKRGPPPLPTAVKKLRGTHQKCRDAPNAMGLPASEPECPAYLDDVARAEWARVVPILADLGVLSEVDGAALEGYCASYARAVKAEETLKTSGLVIEAKQGLVPHPAVAIARNEWAAVRRFAGEFGLTPSARSRVSVPERPKTDEAGDFLFSGAPQLAVVPGGQGG